MTNFISEQQQKAREGIEETISEWPDGRLALSIRIREMINERVESVIKATVDRCQEFILDVGDKGEEHGKTYGHGIGEAYFAVKSIISDDAQTASRKIIE